MLALKLFAGGLVRRLRAVAHRRADAGSWRLGDGGSELFGNDSDCPYLARREQVRRVAWREVLEAVAAWTQDDLFRLLYSLSDCRVYPFGSGTVLGRLLDFGQCGLLDDLAVAACGSGRRRRFPRSAMAEGDVPVKWGAVEIWAKLHGIW